MGQLNNKLDELKKRLGEMSDDVSGDKIAALFTEVFGCGFYDTSCVIDDKNIFQEMLDTIPVAVYYKDTGGVYRACNQKLCEVYGLTRGEIIGKTAYSFFSRDIAESFADGDKVLIEERKEEKLEHRGRFPGMDDGFHIIQKRAFIRNGSVEGIIGVIMDMTEQKMQEDRAWASEAFFKALFENSPMPIVMVDSMGIIEDLNATAEHFFCEPECLAGQDASALFTSYSDYEKVMSAPDGISRAEILNSECKKEKILAMVSSGSIGGAVYHAIAFVRTDI